MIRVAAMVVTFMLVGWVGYVSLVGGPLERLDQVRKEVDEQKTAFLLAKKLAVNLDAYRQQAAELPTCDLTTRPPDGKAFDRIARAATDQGLRITSLKADDARTVTEFFAREAPTELRASGSYHQVGRFLEALSGLPDHVLVYAMRIERADAGSALTLRFDVLRAITAEEEAAWSKAHPSAKEPSPTKSTAMRVADFLRTERRSDAADLKAFVRDADRGLARRIQPLPEFPPRREPAKYTAATLPDPFNPQGAATPRR